MKIDKQVVDSSINAIKVLSDHYDQYGKQLLEQGVKIFTYTFMGFFGVCVIFAVALMILSFLDNHAEAKARLKYNALDLKKLEKESYYWECVGKCADIQLHNLLDKPVADMSKAVSYGCDSVKDRFDASSAVLNPRKGGNFV